MSLDLEKELENISVFPIMGEKLDASNSKSMDFTENNLKLNQVDLSHTEIFNNYVFNELSQAGKKYGYGGYLENRVIYKRSAHFQQAEPRCFHLGVDVWTEAFHPVYAPLDGVVHSFAHNNNFGDYGPTIILMHQLAKSRLYTLYGHLSVKSLENLKEGQEIKKGEKFCELGPFPENGDWPPHLHFQVMTDLMGKKGDFPGVCSASELHTYSKICLNPSIFI
ncbi:peptidoglycan DD-metalloendopeptidase family protein [Marivirga sp. S37H4]|uniref:Peptidoglycan DD-metalloendopeptidase family protein n=1 Tax=Marivirga aurantiaca TaxID=2802615 RepID=A0A934WWK1_9BACT|nr:peptidoglycan DD-metalloendopeptidase family protein [Marivirga aurantiaca]MBK6264247.1 peptidoglycan DD-metalloendopeptidase family protein [Marivirga aurantiaca]